ncbi:MAG: hypothetical protein P1P88_18385 [Bacteroidales bacterium]|nr:hypothetical protein [Bacteroidales bacterium]
MKVKSFKISKLLFVLNLFFIFAILFSSCKKDDDNVGVQIDVNGFWIATETVSDNCSGSVETETKTEIFSVKQNADKLTITFYPIDKEMVGTLVGNTIKWNGTLPTSSGNTTMDFSGTVNSNGTEVTGSASWTWSSTTFECSGTTQVDASKVVAETANFAGDWQGTWQSEEGSYSGTFSVTVIQNDKTLSGKINVPEIGLSNADLTGEVSGNVVFFGDIEGTIKFVGILDNNSGSGDYAYPDYYDDGSWTATKQ